jgi:tetratricopeptide (TPR) repeat protein
MEDSSGFEERAYEEELKHTLNRFIEMQSSDKEYFFDISQFEALFDYFLENGEWDSAEIIIRMAHQQHPAANSIQIREAHLNMAYGKINNALSILNRAEKIEPFNDEILLLKAQVYSQMRRSQKALQYYERALSNAVDNKSEIMLDMAMELEEMQDFQRAIEILKELLAIDNENEIALHEISHCYESLGEADSGIAYFNEFLEIHPFSASGWFNLGEIYMRHGLNDKALESFDFATAINEEYAYSYFNKGIIFANNQDYLSALSCFNDCAEYEGANPMTFCYIGECYEKLGEYDLALDYYNKVLEMDDRWSDAWMGMAVINELKGDYKAAMAMMKNALKSLPDHTEYLLFLGMIKGKLGDFEGAVNTYEKAINTNPENSSVWLDYSEFIDKNKGPGKAVEILEEGMVYNVDQPDYYYRLAAYLLKASREPEALIYLGEALLEDYEAHHLLLSYYPEAINNQNIIQLLEIYKT